MAALTLAALGAACSASVRDGSDSSPSDGALPDGGPSDGVLSDFSSFDTSLESPFRPQTCQMASRVCAGNEVHVCVAGPGGESEAGALIEICPEACSYGRCTSAACAGAEQNDPVHGCRFYPVQVDNVDADDDKNMMLILTNASSVPAYASLVTRPVGGDWPSPTPWTVAVPAHGSARLETSHAVRDAGITRAGAFRLESDQPISVIQLVSDDVDRTATSSGGTVLRPIQALDIQYLAASYPQVSSSTIAATPGGRAGAGMITVVGTVDQTMVTVRSSAPLLVDATTVVQPGPTPYSAPLNEGDVLQIFSGAPAADLSGTSVEADRPIEVFSGNVFTGYNYVVTGLNGPDLAFEQLPPVKAWGTAYVGAWLAPQAGCDLYFQKGSGLWQVLAARDSTSVTITPSDTTVIQTEKGEERTFRLDGRGTKLFTASPRPGTSDAAGLFPPTDFLVTSTPGHPILLFQWLDCEPALSLGIDTRLMAPAPGSADPSGDPSALYPETVIAFPPGFDHQLVIVRKTGAPVWMDGAPLTGAFRPIGPMPSSFEVARFSADELGQCIDLSDGCSHVIRGQVGVSWRGMDVVCSYAVTLPSPEPCQVAGVACGDG